MPRDFRGAATPRAWIRGFSSVEVRPFAGHLEAASRWFYLGGLCRGGFIWGGCVAVVRGLAVDAIGVRPGGISRNSEQSSARGVPGHARSATRSTQFHIAPLDGSMVNTASLEIRLIVVVRHPLPPRYMGISINCTNPRAMPAMLCAVLGVYGATKHSIGFMCN